MTATLPQQGPPTTGGPFLGRRLGIVYGFDIRDHHTDAVHPDDYIGQSIRPLAIREAEHRGLGRDPGCEQPWSDRIHGRPHVLEQGMWTAAELDAREQYWITTLRPRYNYIGNLDNPGRIPIPVARQQRADRDRAAGVVSRWTSPELFVAATAPRRSVVQRAGVEVQQRVVTPSLWSRFWRTRPGRRLLARLIRLGQRLIRLGKVTAALTAVWMAVTVMLLVLGQVVGPGLGVQDAAGGAVLVTGAAVTGWRKWTSPKRRRGRSRQHRAPTRRKAR